MIEAKKAELANAPKEVKGLFKEICPCCETSSWIKKRLFSMNSYFVCNNCSLNLQEITKDFSKDHFFKIQQDHYFGDSEIFNSRLMSKIEAEDNKIKLNMIHKYLGNSSKILEIGPGSGSFAKLIEDLQFNITLVEESSALSKNLVRIIKGKVVNKNISEYKTDERYDAVCAFQVIEHVIDLNQHLKDIKTLLKPKGLIFLTTPNADSFEHKLPFLLSPNFDSAHLYVFSRNSLKLLLKKSGFELLEITTPECSSSWLRVASKILRRIKGKSEIETAGEYIQNSSLLYQAIFNSFKIMSMPFRSIQSNLGRGNDIFIVARKAI
jgi:2-polyprenyl-3-methyl-5-hydroxy-6-metoxy-1,4-benzoquinol methylase